MAQVVIRLVARCCKHGAETSGATKGEFLDYLSVLSGSHEGLCSLQIAA
jgi:hypothetical protein